MFYVKGDLELYESYAIYRKGQEFIDPNTNEVLANNTQLVGCRAEYLGRVMLQTDVPAASVKLEQE